MLSLSQKVKDSFYLALGDMLTSLLAGAMVFSMVGFVAKQIGRPVDQVLTEEGVGLAFIVLPEGLSQLNPSYLWSFAYFFMLFLLGIDSQFGYTENVSSFLFDVFVSFRLAVVVSSANSRFLISFQRGRGVLVNKPLIVCSIGAFLFICGLPLTTGIGIYLFTIMDFFIAGTPVIMVGLIECLIVSHIYGLEQFLEDLNYMTGYEPGPKTKAHLQVALWTIAPFLLSMLIISDVTSLISNTTKGTINGKINPKWAIAFGWLVAVIPLICIPAGMIRYVKNFKNAPGEKKLSLGQKLRIGLRSTIKYKEQAHKSGTYESFKSKELVAATTAAAANSNV